jgi:hypothetical protein
MCTPVPPIHSAAKRTFGLHTNLSQRRFYKSTKSLQNESTPISSVSIVAIASAVNLEANHCNCICTLLFESLKVVIQCLKVQIVIFLFNYHNFGHYPSSCLFLKHKISENGFCLSHQVELFCLRRERDYLFPLGVVPPEGGDRMQSPKSRVLSKKQDDG